MQPITSVSSPYLQGSIPSSQEGRQYVRVSVPAINSRDTSLESNHSAFVIALKVSAAVLGLFFFPCITLLLGAAALAAKAIFKNGQLSRGAGAMQETQRLVVDVQVDDSYLAWKESVERPILESFQTVLDTYQPFENLRCQIALDFPKIAVVDSVGRVYDQESIYEWIDRSGTHPITQERMTSQDVMFDMSYAGALQRAMKDAFGSDEFARINTENPEEVIEGLKVALRTIVLNHNEIVLDRAQQFYNRAMAAAMPRTEARQLYRANMAAFVDMPEELKPKGLLAIVAAASLSSK